jgi:CRP-like cAMP-binding protein
MNARIELLQAMPIFGALREETLDFLLAQSSVAAVPAGRFFFREGDDARSMFVLEEGRAAVLKGWNGRQYLLALLAPGECFGEMSLMDMHQRSASVLATEPCRAIELSTGSLFSLYQKDLEQFTLIQMNMGREVSRRLRHADERLFEAKVAGGQGMTEFALPSA